MSSMNQMSKESVAADNTMMPARGGFVPTDAERSAMNEFMKVSKCRIGNVVPSPVPLKDVRRGLKVMGTSWMEKTGKQFEEWAARHKKVYKNTREREKRRLAYMKNMKMLDRHEKAYPGHWKHGTDLENMDQFEWEAELKPSE